MKKFRFFVVLLGLFALLGFSKTINAQETVNVTITVKKDDTQVGDVVSTTGTLGGTIKVDTLLPEVTDATFMFWTINGVVRTDLDIDSLIKVTSKLDLVAHYASTGKYSVAYLDTNTKLIDVDYVNVSGTLTPPVSGPNPKDVPGRKGTSFDGWALITNYEAPASTALENPGAKAYFVAKYTVTETAEYTVTVDGTPLAGTYKLNDTATAVSTDPNFSYWKDETGAVLSYESSYTFTVLNANVTLTSVNEGEVNEPLVSIRRFVGYETGKNAFIGHYELDLTKYELVEVGFVHYDNPTRHITKNVNNATKEFMVVAPDTLSGDYKMRAYMTYKKIGSNELTTIYSINGIVKISTEADFLALTTAIEENLSKTYKLMNNIALTGWYTQTIGNAEIPFMGTFDGQGFTISGFKGGDSENNFAIFGVIGTTGVVKNLGIKGAEREVDFYRGNTSAFLASKNYGLIENVYVEATIMSGGDLVAGIVGENHGTIKFVLSRVKVYKNDDFIPGTGFALINTGTITNSYVDQGYTNAPTYLSEASDLDVYLLTTEAFTNASTYAGFDSNIWLIREGFVPMLKNEKVITINNKRFTVNAVKETGVTIDATLNAYPEDVLTYALKEPVTGVSLSGNHVTVTTEAVHLSTFTVVVAIQGTSYGKEITFTVRNNPTSCAEVVQITTEDQFKALMYGDEEAMEKQYKLMNDITLTGFYYFPIGSETNPFLGTFDGQGHTITGFQGGDGEHNFGIFGVVGTSGVIKNLGLKGRSTVNPDITVDFYKGNNSAFVASVNYGTIENIYIEGIIQSPGVLVAGIVAHNHGTITNVVSQVKVIKATSQIGPAGALTNIGTITNVFINKGVTGETTFLPEASTFDSFLYAEVDFKAATTYTGILNPTIWEIVDGEVPKLKPQI
jgi:hypothetical protein